MVNRCERVVAHFPSGIAEACERVYELYYPPNAHGEWKRTIYPLVVFTFTTIFRTPLSRLTGIPRPKVLLRRSKRYTLVMPILLRR